MNSIPKNVHAYDRTAEFTEKTIPAGLLRSHTTKAGVWGRIVVLEGRLRYRILLLPREEHLLTAGDVGIVEPEVAHEVEPVGRVLFYVEFLRVPQ